MGAGYRTESEIKALTEEVANFERLDLTNGEDNNGNIRCARPTSEEADGGSSRTAECPICMEAFTNGPVYTCPGCDGLLCSVCVTQIKKCPLCRLQYGACTKPARNKAVERVLMIT